MPLRSASTERTTRAGLLSIAVLAAQLQLAVLACERPPPATPIVTDTAGLILEAQRERLESSHRFLLLDHDVDYRVEFVRAVGDLDLHANARFRELGVGSLSQAGRGLLLVLDAEQDVVRVEVGRGLEGVFPDAFVAYLEHRQMVPYFRAGQIAEGVLGATELIIARIQNARANAGWEAEPWAEGSGGGGARTRAHLGAGEEEPSARSADVLARASPLETVRAYLEAMRSRNADPELDLYTAGTRAMLGGRVITPAQMDNAARSYRSCAHEAVRIESDRAVVRYPAAARDCAPFLLRREDGSWRLDFATAARAIRFGRNNAWHLVRDEADLYAFGFEDWRFDRQGFPRPPDEG